jgi:hypothetical protein
MIKIGKYSICILDLLTDSRTGRLSASKLWLHIANGIMSYIMLHSDSVDWELMAVYGSVVGGSYVAVLFFKLRYASGGNSFGGMDYGSVHEHDVSEQDSGEHAPIDKPVRHSGRKAKGGKR